MGHATVRFTTAEGVRFAVDPWFEGNPLTPAKDKKPADLDVLLVTHGHRDHLSDVLAIAKRCKPQIVAIFEIAHWLGTKGVENTKPMNKGGTQTVSQCKVTMVHAVHSSSIMDEGRLVHGGDACGYVIETPQGVRIYHAGDTDVFGDMALIRRLYAPRIVCLPVGDHYTMGPAGAALAVELLDPERILPLHFGTWPVLRQDLVEFKNRLDPKYRDRVLEVQPGEEFEL